MLDHIILEYLARFSQRHEGDALRQYRPEVLWTPMQSSLIDPRLAHRAEPEASEMVMAVLAGLPYAALPRHLQTPDHTRRLAVPFGERPASRKTEWNGGVGQAQSAD